MIRVGLADDQPVVRMGLRVLIDREDDLELVGEADDGRTALQLARRTHPDVLLLDIRMPGMDGLAALREITADPTLAGTRVVIVTTFEIDQGIPMAFAVIEEPRRPFAVIVEGLAALVLALAAFAVLTRRTWAWAAASGAHAVALAGVLWGWWRSLPAAGPTRS